MPPENNQQYSRRDFLAAGSAGLTAVAGCLDGDSDDDAANGTPPNGDTNGADFTGPEVRTDSDKLSLPVQASQTVTVEYDAGSSESNIFVTLEEAEQDIGRLVEEHLEGGEEGKIDVALDHEEIFTQNGADEYNLTAQIEAISPPDGAAEDQYTDTESVPLTVEGTPFNPEFNIDRIPDQVLPGTEINLQTLLEGEYSEATFEIDGEVYDPEDSFEAGEEGEHEIVITAEGPYGEQTKSESVVVTSGVPSIDQEENMERRQRVWENMLWEDQRYGRVENIDFESFRQIGGQEFEGNLSDFIDPYGIGFIDSENVLAFGAASGRGEQPAFDNMRYFFLQEGSGDYEALISSHGELEETLSGTDIYSVEGSSGQEFYIFFEPDNNVIGWTETTDDAYKMIDFLSDGEGTSFSENLGYVQSKEFAENTCLQEAYNSNLLEAAYDRFTVRTAGDEGVAAHELRDEGLVETIRTSDENWGEDRSLPRDLQRVVNIIF